MTLVKADTGREEEADRGQAVDTAAADQAVLRPTVSVVICAYTIDRWEDLKRAVTSVGKQTADEIVVVIDHCPELLTQAGLLAELLPWNIVVAPNRFQQGLSGARNTGLAVAQGDIVAFLDDDAAADPGWLATMADHYQDPRVLGVGGMVRPDWEGGRPSWFPSELDWVVGCCYKGMPTTSSPVRNFIGANMSFRCTILEDCEGFSSGLGRVGAIPLGCEETELCLRISQRHPDGILLYEPAAAVGHKVPNKRANWRYLRSRCYAEGRSKARVARLAGQSRALASERSYVRSTIPRGIWRCLTHAPHGRKSGALAASAMVAAVAMTTVGYLVGKVTERDARALTLIADDRPEAVPTEPRAQPDAPDEPTEQFSVRPRRRAAVLPWLGLAACLALWVTALGEVNLSRIRSTGLGLVSVMPVIYWAALAGLMCSFAWAVTRRHSRWPLLAAHLLVLVEILHVTPALLYGTPRYSWTWKHVGVIDFIATNGIHFNLGGVLGVYQGWPGFFALNAFLTSASGLHTALGYASWVLPINDLLWLGPVILIARAFTSDWRLVWTAAWLFEIGNWIGQDYFSPQAFSYFLYLTVIAVCLRWLWHPRIGPPPSMADGADGAGHPQPRRWVMVLCLVPMMAAIASSHQLTPFMLLGALILLVVFRQLRPRTLPLLMAAITAGWIMYGGLPWLKAHKSQVLGGLGDPWANISSHIVGQGQVPTGQILVDWDTRAISAAMGILALLGFWRYRRHHDTRARSSWNRLAVLAVAALPAVAANSYGGEIIFRVYLFALPYMAVAAAALFFPSPERSWSLRPAALLAVTTTLLVGGSSVGNYGQEAMNYFTPGEVAAAEWLYRTAPPGAELIAADSNYPWAFVHYNQYNYTFLDAPPSFSRTVLRAPVTTVTRVMTRSSGPAYLILTDSQSVSIALTGLWPPGSYQHMVHALLTSGKLKVVYRNGDAIILQLAR
jgi:glycosyltransferase involved in cell wall biosynthesis